MAFMAELAISLVRYVTLKETPRSPGVIHDNRGDRVQPKSQWIKSMLDPSAHVVFQRQPTDPREHQSCRLVPSERCDPIQHRCTSCLQVWFIDQSLAICLVRMRIQITLREAPAEGCPVTWWLESCPLRRTAGPEKQGKWSALTVRHCAWLLWLLVS